MSLIESANQAAKDDGKQKCSVHSVAALIEKESPDLLAEFQTLLNDRKPDGKHRWEAPKVAKAIQTMFPHAEISAFSVRRHRRGECSC